MGDCGPQRSGRINAKYLTTAAEVQGFVARAAQAPWVGLDTEFVRERTYNPQLCLLQMSTVDELVLVDVLALDDLAILRPLLEQGPVKLVHSPGQDFEALATRGCARLNPLFCTQAAHALLGGPPQIGYAGLVQERLGIALAKDQTRTDWSRRPLSAAQMGYAADDVRHLGELYRQLTDALAAAGRTEWMREEMEVLEQAWALPDPLVLALRARGLERLEPVEQCRFIALSQWREQRARDSDKPRSWIAKDGFLQALARRPPADLDALAQFADCTPGLLRNQGETLLRVLREAEAACPELPAPLSRDAIKSVQKRIQAVAERLAIDPAVLAVRADCEEWLRSSGGRLDRGWRAEVLGQALVADGAGVTPTP